MDQGFPFIIGSPMAADKSSAPISDEKFSRKGRRPSHLIAPPTWDMHQIAFQLSMFAILIPFKLEQE
jgi:hypothetical protein